MDTEGYEEMGPADHLSVERPGRLPEGDFIEPGSAAALLVFENNWAGPLGAAVRRSGGQLISSGRIPAQSLLAALDATEVA